ncbi:MAG: class I SAM-dependent methyltransferase [Anaerolineae bacterium]|nr:class I SAM-dependent methyltransferase [Anaerolineae bacterium]
MSQAEATSQSKAIALGHPSYVWRAGQERRVRLVERYVALEGVAILDVGCGLGLYTDRFRARSEHVYGVDIDPDKVRQVRKRWPQVAEGSAEDLPYPNGFFDVVFSNEVLEHVQDDRAAVEEACRVLKPGGHLVIFTPNRWYPFETHGFYWRGQYHYGNIPLVNYLPNRWRDRLCPHVRAYTRRELRALLDACEGRTIVHRGVFAGYDNIVARHPRLGRLLQKASYALERTPLQWLGLSHLLVFQKAGCPLGN